MVLTDRQRSDLHAGIYEYLQHLADSSSNDGLVDVVTALEAADPSFRNSEKTKATNNKSMMTPILEKKWTAIPRLQKKVMDLERQLSQSSKMHAHRVGADGTAGSSNATGPRRLLPHPPAAHTLQGHQAGVTCVKVHPIYTMLASGSEDGTIKLWDFEGGDYLRTLKGHTNSVHGLSFCPTGTHLASCSTDLSIKLWDVTTYACLKTLRGHDHTISSVVFVPHRYNHNASSNGNQHNANGNVNMSIPSAASAGTASSLALTSNVVGGQYLLSASRDATVRVWDVSTGFCDQTLPHNDWMRTVAARADGSGWAAAGNDTVIYVYDTNDPESSSTPYTLRTELRGHEQVVESVAFLIEDATKFGNGNAMQQSTTTSSSQHQPKLTKHLETARNYLASASRDRTVRLWNIAHATCLHKFAAHENWVRSVQLHPNGLYIVSASDDKSIRVFDIEKQRCLRVLENAHHHFCTALDISATSLPVLVSGSVDQTVKCWPLD